MALRLHVGQRLKPNRHATDKLRNHRLRADHRRRRGSAAATNQSRRTNQLLAGRTAIAVEYAGTVCVTVGVVGTAGAA
jgi:hypothetical protein